MPISPQTVPMPALEDFGKLQQRYHAMGLAARAKTVLVDAEPALTMADNILVALAAHAQTAQILENIKQNLVLTGKMRPSEAKVSLLDDTTLFIDTTRRKLAAWRKTIERVADGEGISTGPKGEFIAGTQPVAIALCNISAAGSYLSIIQLALAELVKLDAPNAARYQCELAKIRRCSTYLSDCELASSISTLVH